VAYLFGLPRAPRINFGRPRPRLELYSEFMGSSEIDSSDSRVTSSSLSGVFSFSLLMGA
ncbi:hypothetical protein AVEN_14103-1, partial [Araneus ventricosus]